MTTGLDLDVREAMWLADPKNVHFRMRPATIREFCGQGYLEIAANVRAGVMEALVEVFGEELDPIFISRVREAMVTGGIGIGKTTLASIALPYMVHWVQCLKDPQGFYDLMSGTKIAFMMMSTSARQARDVLFDDVKARIDNSPWFAKYSPRDDKFDTRIVFPRQVYIIPGGSEETQFEGYNILGGVLDEGDCVDQSTEILTSTGWKNHESLSVGDMILTLNHETGLSEWQPCLDVARFDAGPREVLDIDGKEFSSVTTMNHRWPVVRPRESQGKKYLERAWSTSGELKLRDRILRCANPGDRPEAKAYSDSLVEIVAWFYTEGTSQNGSTGAVHIYQSPKNKSNCERIRSALAAEFGESVEAFPRSGRNTDGVPRWRETSRDRGDDYWGLCNSFILSSDASKILQALAPDKVPSFEFLLSLTSEQLEIFIKVSLLADNNGERRFAQKSRPMAEAYAFACILSGRPVSIRQYEETKSCTKMWGVYSAKKTYHMPIMSSYQSERKGGLGLSAKRRIHNGIVWCPRVANGTWFARRQGTCYFTGNSHKKTTRKDYAQEGWNTIASRIDSRFNNPQHGCHMGLLMVIGQKKSSEGFMAKKQEELSGKPDAHVTVMTIWESKGWYNYTDNPADAVLRVESGERKSFYFDTMRKEVLPKESVMQEDREAKHMIEVPMAYFSNFVNDPVKALKDLAGLPPAAVDPFIPQTDRIITGQTLWAERYGPTSPVVGPLDAPQFPDWFVAPDQLKRVIHIDLAFSGDGDALGIAMGHIPELIEVGGEEKPLVVFDFLLRMKAKPGKEVILGDVRKLIYELKFKRNFNIKAVTMDGFNTTDTMQQFRKKKLNAQYLSVDKSKMPYVDLREAIYEERCLFPDYMVKYNHMDNDSVNIAFKELSQLSEGVRKVDHPSGGSKDVADCMAGVVHTLMNEPGMRRGIKKGSSTPLSGDDDASSVEEMLAKLSVPSQNQQVQQSFEGGRTPSFDEFKQFGLADQSSGLPPHVERNGGSAGPTRLW